MRGQSDGRSLGTQLGTEREFKVSELDSTGYRNLEEETDEKVLSKMNLTITEPRLGFALD